MNQVRPICLSILLCLLLCTGCRQSDTASALPPTMSVSAQGVTQAVRTSSPLAQATNALTQWAQTSDDLPPDTEITLKRTACFGTCPIYSLHVDADGHVQFDGENYVSHKGKNTGQTTVAHVRQLLQQFAALNFFALRDQYGRMGDCSVYATDNPSVIITLQFAVKTKTVELYLGCIGSPEAQAVVQLGEQIDAAIDSKQWIK
jgi:hypothetical protein